MNSNNQVAGYVPQLAKKTPMARAALGGPSGIHGTTELYQTPDGVLVVTEVWGLPYQPCSCDGRFFALHIHEGNACTGNAEDPFANAKGHYNPFDCEHPAHAGDLPPLLGSNGHAWSAVLTRRFNVANVIGRAVIVHEHADDFTTQPAGHAGAKLACGVINLLR